MLELSPFESTVDLHSSATFKTSTVGQAVQGRASDFETVHLCDRMLPFGGEQSGDVKGISAALMEYYTLLLL